MLALLYLMMILAHSNNENELHMDKFDGLNASRFKAAYEVDVHIVICWEINSIVRVFVSFV